MIFAVISSCETFHPGIAYHVIYSIVIRYLYYHVITDYEDVVIATALNKVSLVLTSPLSGYHGVPCEYSATLPCASPFTFLQYCQHFSDYPGIT